MNHAVQESGKSMNEDPNINENISWMQPFATLCFIGDVRKTAWAMKMMPSSMDLWMNSLHSDQCTMCIMSHRNGRLWSADADHGYAYQLPESDWDSMDLSTFGEELSVVLGDWKNRDAITLESVAHIKRSTCPAKNASHIRGLSR